MMNLKLLMISLAVFSLGSTALADGGAKTTDTNNTGTSTMDTNTTRQNQVTQQQGRQALDQSTIREAQEKLSDEGFDVNADGLMGPETESAVKRYQNANNLEPTGWLDQSTLNSLGIDAGERAPASVPESDQQFEDERAPTSVPESSEDPMNHSYPRSVPPSRD